MEVETEVVIRNSVHKIANHIFFGICARTIAKFIDDVIFLFFLGNTKVWVGRDHETYGLTDSENARFQDFNY